MKNNFCKIDEFPELSKYYKIIAFDWDGTAVKGRKDNIPELIFVLEGLLKQKVYIIVITGTNFDNIDKQFSSYIRGIHKKYLYILTNRGSEVFRFNENSIQERIYYLIATEEQNRLLDKIAEKTKLDIEKKSENIKLDLIYNRLNRRKLDLIPEWEDPLKSEIDRLVTETENKLKKSGFTDGIKGAFDLMKTNAQVLGLNDARITSDVKHIEVGLSDKSDSVKWILDNIAAPHNISDREILILGDEFGPIAGFEGSDYKMVMKNRKELTYFSVGIEPNGAPAEVKLIGGGPACFLEIMKRQLKFSKKQKGL